MSVDMSESQSSAGLSLKGCISCLVIQISHYQDLHSETEVDAAEIWLGTLLRTVVQHERGVPLLESVAVVDPEREIAF